MEVEDSIGATDSGTADDARKAELQRLAAEAWGCVERLVRSMERRYPAIDWSGPIAERICSLVGTFDPKRSTLGAWANGHAAFAIKDVWRGLRSLGFRRRDGAPAIVSRDALAFEPDALAVEDPKPAWEIEEDVRDLLRGLPARAARILWENDVAGMPLHQVARDLGISRSMASEIRMAAILQIRERDPERARRSPLPAGRTGRPIRRDVDAAEVERLYREGLATEEVGAILGCSANVVRHRLRAKGVAMRPTGSRPLLEIDTARAAQLYREGLATEEVGAILGCSKGTVRKRLHAAGVALRPAGGAGRKAGGPRRPIATRDAG